MKKLIESIQEWTKEYPYQTIGLVAGFFVSLLIVLIGFWKAIFVFLMTCIGYLIGKNKDGGHSLSDLGNRIKEFFKIERK